jgi:glucose-6-phosphate 1-dehydrogenase
VAVGEQAPVSESPLAAGLERPPIHPTTLVIFGASGDLANRKLLPAIYNLAHDGALPIDFHLVGISRGELSDEDFRAMAARAVRRFSRRRPDENVLEQLLESACYVAGSFDDPAVYRSLARALDRLDAATEVPLNRCYYLSTAPNWFGPIVRHLGEAGLNQPEHAKARVVIEKPFGRSLAEAVALNAEVLSVFEECQVFRIDHYLGKETVQNLMALRFANGIFEPVWNRNYVDHVQITAAEDIGVGDRAEYYDATGALRDLVQNHMLQLLCHVAMEPPVVFEADEVRNEKVKVLHAIAAPSPAEVPEIAARGQYGPGVVGGEPVPGYLDEPGVPPDSRTETYAAVRLEVDSWRWAGVPFYLRTGKRLPRKLTEIAITLKPVPHLPFRGDDGAAGAQPNTLVLMLQPEEGISLSLAAKIPGTRMLIRPVNMEFRYGTAFLSQSPEAYERLLLDAMRGDATLFTRNDEVEAQWRICDPILDAWRELPGRPPAYPAGSQGPAAAEEILLPGHSWRRL